MNFNGLDMDMDMGMSPIMFIFIIVFVIMFVLVFGFIAYTIHRGIATERKNDRSPILTVHAIVVAKRIKYRKNSMDDMNMNLISYYYITFQVDSGDRMELMVPDSEYGMLTEGDNGILTFQGTRYLKFDRI